MNVLSMKGFSIPLLLVLLVFYLLPGTYAQNSVSSGHYEDLQFEHLSIEHGLSQINVHSILQDTKGFLWFGTEDGLNRYDGYNFVIYRNELNDPTTISDNFIWSLAEDSNGNIWIGTNSGGLYRYSYETDSFNRFVYDSANVNTISENNIRALYFDDANVLWIGTNSKGLSKYSISDDKIFRVELTVDEGIPSSLSIRDITEDNSGNLWIATEGRGLIKYNKSTKKSYSIDSFKIDRDIIEADNIWTLLYKENILWIGTYGEGMLKYNLETDDVDLYKSGTSGSIVDNNITSIVEDRYDNLWISTENGLSIYNTLMNTFVNYKNDPYNIKSLSSNIIRCSYIDNTNLIWLGTFGGGINKVNLNRKFKLYLHNPSNKNSISHNIIRAIYEDSQKNIWIGTLGNGLNKLSSDKEQFEHFTSSDQGLSISGNIITSILEDDQKFMWVGTWGGGLNRIKFKTSNVTDQTYITTIKYFTSESSSNPKLSSSIVQALFQDSKNNIWIGTEEGLDLYQKKQNRITSFKHNPLDNNSISDNRIQSNCIIEDRHGNIWVGTWNGLNKLTFNSGSSNLIDISRFSHSTQNLNTLSDNRVVALYEDKLNEKTNSLIWIGTVGGGLNKLMITYNDDATMISSVEFKRYTEDDGLPNNVVYGILGDDDGNIWLSTNNGISEFNPETEQFTNYDIRDGLQSNQFSWGAYYKSHDGELYFGGINGLNSFYPGELVKNSSIPPVFITNCTVINSEDNETKNAITFNSFSSTKLFELPYSTYTVNFEFAAMDFTTPDKNQYEYFLEGFDKGWVKPVAKNSVTYSSLQDGDYIFRVRGSNNDGVWNDEGASLSFVIKTPFWKTWWFFAIILIILIVFIAYLIIVQIKNILAVERLRTKLAADLHDNIGSSLTEISILSEVISTKLFDADKDVKKNLKRISDKSRNLIDKMSDIVWLVNPKRDSLYDLILRLQDTYSELLADTNISLKSENLKALEKVSLNMEDRQHLFLIFKEAINNSITHAKCTEISLNAKVNGKRLEMVLKDNGTGFNDKKQSSGNGLENMANRAETIRGKLYISSSTDNGTEIKYIGHIN